MTEEPPGGSSSAHRDDECQYKTEWFLFHTIDEVHSKERGNERWKHHDDGDGSQRTHHGVHVVVDDARIGVHCRLEDVRVDGRCLAGLGHLNVHVFDEVGIELVDLELELQFREQCLVASDGGLEIGERILQAAKSYQRLVVHVTVEVALGFVDERVDLLLVSGLSILIKIVGCC